MIVLPIYWQKSSSKTILVSLNWYRNAFYHEQNNLKQYYHQLVGEQLEGISPISGPFQLDLSLYYKNPNCDGSNIASMMEKVVLDALQEHQIIINDNVKYHLGSTWRISAQDKTNPRGIINMNPCEEENAPST
jgi:hypothetical protein